MPQLPLTRRALNIQLKKSGAARVPAKVAKGILDRWRAMTTDERADQFNLQASGISPEVARALAMQGNGKAPKRQGVFGGSTRKSAYATAYRKAAKAALDADTDAALHRAARASAGGVGARVANRGRASEGNTLLLKRARRMAKRAASMMDRVDKMGPTLAEVHAPAPLNGGVAMPKRKKLPMGKINVDDIIKDAYAQVAKGGPGSGPKPGGGSGSAPTDHQGKQADSHLAAAARHIARAREARAAGDHANAAKHTELAHGRMTQAMGASAQRLAKAGTFNESDHPRAEDGKFGEGSGGGHQDANSVRGAKDRTAPKPKDADVASLSNPKPSSDEPELSKKTHPRNAKKATDAEIATAIEDYTNVGYFAMNEQAMKYDKEKPTTKREKVARRRAEALSQAINANKTQENTTLYRGFALPPGTKVGDVLDSHGFTSASLSKKIAGYFAEKSSGGSKESVFATINAPKGTPALDVAAHANSSQGSKESEYIFDHRTKFRVVSDGGKNKDGHRQLTLEPVLPHLAPTAGKVAKRHMVAQLANQMVQAAYAPPQMPGPTGGFEDPPDCAQYLDAQRLVAGMDQETSANADTTPAIARARASGALATNMGAYDRVVAGADRAIAGVGGLNLDLGSGQARERGFLGIDLYPYDYGTVIHDLGLGIPFPDGSARAVRLMNALADMPDYAANPTELMLEVQRVLAIGGRFYYQGAPIQDSVNWDALPGLGVVSHRFDSGGTLLSLTLARVPAKLPLVYGADTNFLAVDERQPADLALSQATFGAVPNASVAMANLVHKREHVEVKARVLKKEDWQHVVQGAVLIPGVVDSQGDYMTAEDIEKTAHDFMANARVVGKEHSELWDGGEVVESYIAPMDMDFNDPSYGPQNIPKGTWVLGVRLPPESWSQVLDGSFTGFSVGGWGEREDVPAE